MADRARLGKTCVRISFKFFGTEAAEAARERGTRAMAYPIDGADQLNGLTADAAPVADHQEGPPWRSCECCRHDVVRWRGRSNANGRTRAGPASGRNTASTAAVRHTERAGSRGLRPRSRVVGLHRRSAVQAGRRGRYTPLVPGSERRGDKEPCGWRESRWACRRRALAAHIRARNGAAVTLSPAWSRMERGRQYPGRSVRRRTNSPTGPHRARRRAPPTEPVRVRRRRTPAPGDGRRRRAVPRRCPAFGAARRRARA